MSQRIDLKSVIKDTKENFLASNVLPRGFIAFEEESNLMKLTDGETPYAELPYFTGDSSAGQVNYENLSGKPTLNGIEISGAKSASEFGLAESSNVYTKAEVDTKITAVYKFKGSVAVIADLPKKSTVGDVYNVEEDGGNYAWDGKAWDKLGSDIDLSAYATKEEVALKQDKGDYALKSELPEVPSNVSAFTNDAGYLTEHQDISGKAEDSFVNEELAKKQDRGDYALRSELPEVPTKVSAFENDKNYLTEHQDISGKADKADLEGVVKYENYGSEDRKTIKLDNHNVLSGKMLNGTAVPLAMLSKYDVADYGSQKVQANINSIPVMDGHGIVTVNDNEAIITDKILSAVLNESGNVKSSVTEIDFAGKKFNTYSLNVNLDAQATVIDTNALLARLSELEDKVSDIRMSTKSDMIYENGGVNFNDTGVEVKSQNATLVKPSRIEAKSITIDNLNVIGDENEMVAIVLSSEDDIEIKKSNIQGAFPKTTSNTIINVIKSDYVSIKDTTFDVSKSYNAIEAGMNNELGGMLMDNVRFIGKYDNNVVSIHSTAECSVININNCHFGEVSNVLRLSNKTNAKNVVINITNCSCDKWADGDYRGMIILQDFTSKSINEAQTNNLFAPEKLTINISNFIYNGRKLVQDDLEDVLYLYRNAEKKVIRSSSENSKMYLPIVNIM